MRLRIGDAFLDGNSVGKFTLQDNDGDDGVPFRGMERDNLKDLTAFACFALFPTGSWLIPSQKAPAATP